MKKQAKSSGVSRRDFLKGVGGGAVGTAMISRGLLSPNPVEAAQKVASTGKKKIPGGITPEDFMEMRKLLDQILKDKTLQGAGAREVIMRLNQTGEKDPAPVFVGWVEHDDLVKARTQKEGNESDPGLLRFGDDNYSVVYNQTVSETASKGPDVRKERIWTFSLLAEKSNLAKALVPKAGLGYQRYIGIIAQGRCVGTLSVALSGAPNTDRTKAEQTKKDIDGVLKSKAQDSGSALVKFLDNFVVGGPPIVKK